MKYFADSTLVRLATLTAKSVIALMPDFLIKASMTNHWLPSKGQRMYPSPARVMASMRGRTLRGMP
ncbi:hypothetical protein BG418_18260 [Streptomyces sp. CBMA152]|nr:hypothetical protein [Streptomyces sp. CBMA152]